MTALTEKTEQTPNSAGGTHVLHSILHFIRIIRHRKGIAITCVVISMALSALYYTTATKYYRSKAGILVMQTGSDVNSTRITPEGARQGLMPTYERILKSAEVVSKAIEKLPSEHRVDLEDIDQVDWVNTLRRNLNVKTVRHSNIIEVTYRSKTPEAAAAVVHAVVDSYLEFMKKTNESAALSILRALNEEKDDTNKRLAAKQQEIMIARHQMLDIGTRTENGPVHPVVKQAIELNDALIAVKQRRLALQASLASIQATVQAGGDLSQHILALEGEIGRELLMANLGIGTQDSSMIAQMEQQLISDRSELNSLRAGFGENHPRMIKLTDRINSAQTWLENHQKRLNAKLAQMQTEQLGPLLLRIVQERLNDTIRHEIALSQSYDEARNQANAFVTESGRLDILEQDERFLRRLRDGLLEKIAQIDLTQTQGNLRTEVTDKAEVIRKQVWPQLHLVGLMGMAAGLVVGVVIISVLDILDDKFRSAEELQEQLRTPVLALVRKLTPTAETGMDALQMHAAPDAPESEAFRTMRTAITFNQADSGQVVISSSEPGDGKTTILANLAVTYARSGKRTLLIDSDMRRPGLTKLMEMRGKHGLTQLLQSTKPVAELAEAWVLPSGIENLDVLPSGPRQVNPAELLSGPRLPELLAWAESVYDQVLIDAPPVMAAADACIVARLTDGLVLVVNPEKNKRQVVLRAFEAFHSMGVRPIGLVVNGVGTEGNGYYSYDEGYGYGELNEENQSFPIHPEESVTLDAQEPSNEADFVDPLEEEPVVDSTSIYAMPISDMPETTVEETPQAFIVPRKVA